MIKLNLRLIRPHHHIISVIMMAVYSVIHGIFLWPWNYHISFQSDMVQMRYLDFVFFMSCYILHFITNI